MLMPSPWTPATVKTPLIIYGASSAVGCFAVKLAMLSNIHPIISVAGRSTENIKTIIDSSKGDVVLDYRQGEEKLAAAIRKALGAGESVKYIFDAISTPDTINFLGGIIDPTAGVLGTVLLQEEGINIPQGVSNKLVFAPQLWFPIDENQHGREEITNRESGSVFFRYLEYILAHNLLSPHPSQVLPGGLRGLEEGLKAVKDGKNSGVKYLYRIAET